MLLKSREKKSNTRFLSFCLILHLQKLKTYIQTDIRLCCMKSLISNVTVWKFQFSFSLSKAFLYSSAKRNIQFFLKKINYVLQNSELKFKKFKSFAFAYRFHIFFLQLVAI